MDSDDSVAQLIPGLPCEISCICLALTPRSHHGVMRQVSKGWNEFIRGEFFWNIRNRSGVKDKWFLVLTWKSNAWKAYCPAMDRWGNIASIPAGMANLTSFGAVVVNKQLYIIGGRSNSLDTLTGEIFDTTSRNEVWVYDIAKNRWSEGPPMNIPRSSFASAVLDRKIFVAGGRDHTGRCLDSAEVFDLENQTWTMISSMDSMRYFCHGFMWHGKFIVYQQRSNGVEIYDPMKKAWTQDDKAQIQGQCAVVDGRVYCLNGAGQIQLHDPSEDLSNSITVGALEPPHANLCYGRAVADIGGRLAVFGGTRYDGEGFVSNEIRFWDPATHKWSKSAALDVNDPTVVGFAVVDV